MPHLNNSIKIKYKAVMLLLELNQRIQVWPDIFLEYIIVLY